MNVGPADFDKIHRYGRSWNGKPRPVIAKCYSLTTRDRILHSARTRGKQGNRGIFIGEDLPEEIRSQRADLRTVANNAKHLNNTLNSTLNSTFDTLNKDILLNKLHRYGIRGTPNKWIRSYLTGRSQQTILTSKDILSDNSRIDIGVPQGSILGPILFLIYINDLPNFNKEVFTLMFADDSSLFLSGPNLDELMLKVKKAIIEVKAWIDTNKLSLNLGKTKYMIFTKREIIRKYDYISISESRIERVGHTKFLGFTIQENLKWSLHVNNILEKISKGIAVLRKVRKYLNKDALLSIYYSFIYPYIQRGLIIWANDTKSNMVDILKKQKQVVRIIAGIKYREHTVPYFKKFEILPLDLLYKQQLIILMYNVFHQRCPDHISKLFKLNREVNINTKTRQADDYFIPTAKLKTTINSPIIQASKLYNNYKNQLDVHTSLGTQKRMVKRMILGSYTENLDR